MKRLPAMSYNELKKHGVDISGKKLIMVCDKLAHVKPGDLVVLSHDDDTYNPSFTVIFGMFKNHTFFINMNRLAIYDENDPEHAAFRVKRKLGG
jgi:exonuclease V gamma subunit